MTQNQTPIKAQKARVKAMVIRMAQAYGLAKKDLPAFLGFKPNIVNNWIYCRKIPIDELDQCSRATGTSMDWLIYGVDQKLSDHNVSYIHELVMNILTNAVEFGLIDLKSPEALQQFADKLESDLKKHYL